MAKWSKADKQRHKDKARRKSYRARFRLRELLRFCRQRAKKSGTPFDITEADFDHLPTHCPILGIQLHYGGNGKGRQDDNSATIDRIDNARGYVRDNVLICSWRANRIKSDGTADRQIVEFFCRSLSANNLLHSTSTVINAPTDSTPKTPNY